MKLLETTNIYGDLIFGVLFCSLGGYILLRRKTVIDALLSSNKVFWDKIGFAYNEKASLFMTNIMIPTIAVLFLCVGILLIYRVIIFLLK